MLRASRKWVRVVRAAANGVREQHSFILLRFAVASTFIEALYSLQALTSPSLNPKPEKP